MIIPEWLLQEHIANQIKKINNPKPLKQIVGDDIKLDDKQLEKELATKATNPYYVTDRALRVRSNITVESHHLNHANSKITITPNYPEVGIEVRFINKIIEELSIIYARLKNQNKSNIQQYFQQDLINKMKIIKY